MTTDRYLYRKQWRLDQARGAGPRYISAAPAAAHLNALSASGMNYATMSRLSGVGLTTLSRVSTGRQPRVRIPTARALLAIPSGHAADTTLVDRTGTVRRIEALLVMGWRHDDIHKVAGVRTHLLPYEDRTTVTRSTARAVATAYRKMSDRNGPSNRTRARAIAAGYHGPMAWEDIDDPACQPDDAGEQGNASTVLEDASWLLEQGERPENIHERLGITRKKLREAVGRSGDEWMKRRLGLGEAA